MIRKRQLFFLIDVIWFTLTAFGGAQAHVGMMLKNFVKKREEFLSTPKKIFATKKDSTKKTIP